MRTDPKAVAASQTALESAQPPAEGERRSRPGSTPPASVAAPPPAAGTAGARPVAVTARLERIRAMLEAGEYPVDLDQLAARIVDDDLLRAGTGS